MRQHSGTLPPTFKVSKDFMNQTRHPPGACCCDHEQHVPESLRAQFDELTTPLIHHLLGHARSILHSEDLAWDAVQEALLGLWRKARVGDQILDHAGPWLCRAVVLRSLQISRQTGRRTRHERVAATCRPENDSCQALQNAVETSELQQILEIAVASLPDEFRTVVELRAQDGLDYAATAQKLGVPLGTVRSRLNRARTLLQKMLRSAICDQSTADLKRQGEIRCVLRNESVSIPKRSVRNGRRIGTNHPELN